MIDKNSINRVNLNSFELAMSRLSNEDRDDLNNACKNSDVEKIGEILSRSGYAPLKSVIAISKESSELIASNLISSGLSFEGFSNKVISDFDLFEGRASKISTEDHSAIMKAVIKQNEFYLSENSDIPERALFEGAASLLNAIIIMDVLGFMELRDGLSKHLAKGVYNVHTENIKIEYDRKTIIKQDRSKARKGKKNRHYEAVVSIAASTWAEYRNASISGMTEEIWSHLRTKYNDVPTMPTIQGWINDSGFVPDIPAKERNRKFNLVF